MEGFVTIYKKDNVSHIYFYPGKDKNSNLIYTDLTLNTEYNFDKIKNPDSSIDFIFNDNDISTIDCNLRFIDSAKSPIKVKINI